MRIRGTLVVDFSVCPAIQRSRIFTMASTRRVSAGDRMDLVSD